MSRRAPAKRSLKIRPTPELLHKTIVFYKKLLSQEEIKGIVKFSERFYGLRRKADYSSEILEDSEDAKQSLLLYLSKRKSLLKSPSAR